MRQLHKNRRCRGFTLLELLIVISIILILMGFTMKVAGALLDMSRHAATDATLAKIQSLMNSRRQAFDRLTSRKGFISGTTPEAVWVSRNFGPTARKQLVGKLLQMKYFPQSADDLNFLMGTVYAGNPSAQLQFANTYPKLFQPFNNNVATFSPPLTVVNLTGQEVLYNLLTENVIGDAPVGMDAFTTAEVVTDPLTTAGLPYWQDAWRKPIVFYRWPTHLFRSGGAGAPITDSDVLNSKVAFANLPTFTGNLKQDLLRDPDDPLQACVGVPGFEQLFHTPATFHMPLIVSAGPDGVYGFGDRLALVTDPVALSDNLVSASIKAGGK